MIECIMRHGDDGRALNATQSVLCWAHLELSLNLESSPKWEAEDGAVQFGPNEVKKLSIGTVSAQVPIRLIKS